MAAALSALVATTGCSDEPFQVDFRVYPSDLLRDDEVPFLTGGPHATNPPKVTGDGRFPNFDRLTGFGVTGAITINFTDRLDLDDLLRRHRAIDLSRDETANGGLPREVFAARRRFEFADDAVFLLNVDARCRRYGEEVLLDLGRGLFPSVRACADGRCPGADPSGGALFDGDPDASANDALLEFRDEDLDGDGLLDDGEDQDGDGLLDAPQLLFSTDELDSVKDSSFAEIRRNPCLSLDDVTKIDRCLVDHATTFADGGGRSLVLHPAWALEAGCRHVVLVTNRVRSADGRPAESPFETPFDPRQARAVGDAMPFLSRFGLDSTSIAYAFAYTTTDIRTPLAELRDGLRREGPLRTLGIAVPEDLKVDVVSEPPAVTGHPNAASGACVARSMEGLAWLETLSDEEQCALAADWSHVSHVVSGSFRSLAPVTNLLTLDGADAGGDTPTAIVPWTCVVPKPTRTDCPRNPDVPVPGCAPFPVTLYVHDLGGSRLDLFEEAGRLAAFGLATCGIDGPAHGFGGDRAALRAVMASFGLTQLGASLVNGRAADVDGDGRSDSGAEFLSPDPFVVRDGLVQWIFDHLVLLRELRGHDGIRHSLAEPTRLVGDFDADGTPDLGGRNNRYGLHGTGLGANVAVVVGALEPAIDGVVAVSPLAGVMNGFVRGLDPIVRQRVLRPLVEPNESSTHLPRNSRDFRDFIRRAQHVLDLVDAAAWAPYVARFPIDQPSDTWFSREGEPLGPPTPGASLLVLATLGDPIAPPDSAVRLAINAGLLGDFVRDPTLPSARGHRELLSPPVTRHAQRQPGYALADGTREILSWPEALVAVQALEGVSRLGRHSGSAALVDVDGLVPLADRYEANADPFRIEQSRRVEDVTRVSGLRFIAPSSADRIAHGLAPTDPRSLHDISSHARNLVGRWLATLNPAAPSAPHRDPRPDPDPATRSTKHRIDDRACAVCASTRAVDGCSLSTCDLDLACVDLGLSVDPDAAPIARSCP